MQVRRLALQRLTALLLPVAFLWLWAACAVICGQEAADHSARPSSAGIAALEGASECECPIAAFPEAAAPDARAAFDASSQTPPPAPPPAAVPAADHAALAEARRPPPPPLELLSTLRI
jgi:hypothetical protein